MDGRGRARRKFLTLAAAAASGARLLHAGPAASPGPSPHPPDTTVLRLDRNENPLGPSPRVSALLAADAAAGAASRAGRYPDDDTARLRAVLSAHHNQPSECFVPACGSIEAIGMVLRELVREGDRVVTPGPVFHLLPALVGLTGGVLVPVPCRADGGPEADALAQAPRPRMIFLASPHNPTGSAMTLHTIDWLAAARTPGSYLVVDEAYLPYGGGEGQSAISLVGKVPDLVVLRTLSKAHGLAGLRLGYAVAEPKLAARLARHAVRNGVGSQAELVAAVALADREHLTRVTDLNAKARAVLTQGLTESGWKPLASSANFVMADVGPSAGEVQADLLRAGIAVHRPPDRPEALRVTTGTLPQMARFIEAVKARR